MVKYQYMPLNDNVEEMFIGPFGSSLKNDSFVDESDAFCMVYEQKHAIKKTMNLETRYVNREKYEELKRFNIHGGDIIVSCRGTIGETYIVPDDAPLGIMHPSIMKIRLKPGVYNKQYFNLLLQNYLKQHEDEANGSGIKMAISAKELGATLFPVPNMAEQNQIASAFTQVEELISLRKEQLAKLDQLVKSRFVELFGDPVQNPMEWETVLLKSATSKIGSGATPKGGKESYQTEGITLIRSMNVHDGRFEYKDLAHITDEQAKQLENVTVEENDVFINITGASVARSCIVPKHILPARVNQHVAIIRCITSMLNPMFANHMFLNTSFKGQLLDIGESSGATRQAITKQQLETLTVILPPLEQQERFATFVEQTDKSKLAVQKSLEQLETLKKSLMQQYFG